jgi:hypothetical protein
VGIHCPILPGVMPIMAYGGFKRMTSFCKTAVPQHIADTLEAIKGSDDAVKVRTGGGGGGGGAGVASCACACACLRRQRGVASPALPSAGGEGGGGGGCAE